MEEEIVPRSLLYKVLVVGDIGAGKTSIIRRYVHGIFSMKYKTTIGVDFALKVLRKNEDTIRLQLWDIAGQERFGSLTRVYYRDAVGALVVFDVTVRTSLESIRRWKNDIDSKVTGVMEDNLPAVLLANKVDAITEEEFNSQFKDKLDKLCTELGFVAWFPTSAKDDLNIGEAADKLINDIYINHNDQLNVEDRLKISESPRSNVNEKNEFLPDCCE
eukprot:TRINITY_DN4812_c0_g1_i1.p1 TRINITY_DN4812_c0_g1~~TRINITY_DN4812_c0_g1_i1.p1  ORF type:complete len:232 (-),score=55.24 TRINITY_DN4812_c0_g1_i1:23-673(-)